MIPKSQSNIESYFKFSFPVRLKMTNADLNTRAFMSAIKQTEFGDVKAAYELLHYELFIVNNKRVIRLEKFNDYSEHPYITRKLNKGTAAGAYQILLSTYRNFCETGNYGYVGLNDFKPKTQDKFAIAILKDVKALRFIQSRDLANAYKLLTIPKVNNSRHYLVDHSHTI